MIREVDRISPDEIDRFDLIAAIALWISHNEQRSSLTLSVYLQQSGLKNALSDRALALSRLAEQKEDAIALIQVLLEV